MPKLSKLSKERLSTCDVRLQEICNEVIKHIDFTVLIGYRDQKDQDLAFKNGTSKLKWPNSKHNSFPSKAVDIAPYPIDWHNRDRFCLLAGWMLCTAKQKGIKLRWGGDWNRNYNPKDETFQDFPHFEIDE